MAKIVVYDPTNPLVPGCVTSYNASANTPDYDGEPNKLVNPDLAGLEGVVPFEYWKAVGSPPSSVVEMNQTEKNLVTPDDSECVRLNESNSQTPPAHDACFKVNRTFGGSPNVDAILKWNETTDTWQIGFWSNTKDIATLDDINQLAATKKRICATYTGDVIQSFQATQVSLHFEQTIRCDHEYYTQHHAEGEIEVLQSGWYLVMGGIAIEATSTSRNVSIVELRVDGGSIDGSQAYGFHYGDGSRQSVAARGVIHLNANEKVQVFVGRDSGKSTLQTVENTGRLTLIKLDDPDGSPA